MIGQCKAEKKGLGPKVVRELEGVMAHMRGECGESGESGDCGERREQRGRHQSVVNE